MDTQFSTIRFERDGGVATLTFNRPDRLNSFTVQMHGEVRAALDAVGGISATWSPEGKLRVTADAGFEFSFEDDTSGVLAVMGVNSYFAGSTAGDIAVRQDLVSDPTKLMVGRVVNGTFVENGNALEFVKLQDTAPPGWAGGASSSRGPTRRSRSACRPRAPRRLRARPRWCGRALSSSARASRG